MNMRVFRWLLVPICAFSAGCAAVRESPFAQDTARAVRIAQAYDAVADAKRSGNDDALRRGVDAWARAAGESGASLRLSSAESMVHEAMWAEVGTGKLPEAARLEARHRAEQLFRHAIALAPDFKSADPQLLNALGYFLADRGRSHEDYVLAEKLTRRAVGIFDDEVQKNDTKSTRAVRATVRDSLAWALFRLNRMDEAEKQQREAIREAVANNAMSAELPLHLGDILVKAGKVPEARIAYQQALTLEQGEPDAHSRARAALANLP